MVDFAFLDSGTGGIPYLLHLKEILPQTNCVYIGDTANFPYGEKSHEQIVELVISLVKKVIQKFEPKVIVIACNTMSVNALNLLREIFPNQQFVGTVPAIKLAASVSQKKRIGLLATKATVDSPYNQDLKNHFASDCELILRADPDLISFIEHKSFLVSQEERKNACVSAVKFFIQNDCDVIILGCTHFLNLKDEMQEVCDENASNDVKIQVVDSVEGVVNRAIDLFNCGKGDSSLIEKSTGNSTGAGVLGGGNPLGERVASNHVRAQGETSPSQLFITGFTDKKDEKEYDVICKNYHLNFGGVL